jgi:uncharacterized hydrophobic protein (TIGR00271 family)
MPDTDEIRNIVAAVGGPDDLIVLLAVAAPLARSQGGSVTPLYITDGHERPTWLRVPEELADVVEEPVLLSHQEPAQAILSYIRHTEPDLLLLEWDGEISRGRYLLGRTLDRVIQFAPCNVAVLRVGAKPSSFRDRMATIEQILVPSGGGPNASLALSLALGMASEAQVTVLRVASTDLGPTAVTAQWEMLRAAIGPALADERLRPRVVRASNVVEGIVNEAQQGYGLVLVGATQESLIDRLVFGNLPQDLSARLPLPLMIIRRRDPMGAEVLRHARWRLVNLMTQLTENERVSVYRQVRRHARTSDDFYVMMMASAGIASMGLLLNSAAVIIGAMLVAPLMAALVGIGMGIVQGDSRLLRLAIRTAVLGMLVALIVSMGIALALPEHRLTSEMLGRCSPNLLDLAVALVSGAAAAYATTRKDVATALSGVAIAVALVPPLATFGLLSVMSELRLALGALLLFLTNLAAIVSAVMVVFLWVGFRPNIAERLHARTFRGGIAGALTMLITITAILGLLTARSIRTARLNATVEILLANQVAGLGPGAEMEEWSIATEADGSLRLRVRIAAAEDVAPEQARALQNSLAHNLGRPVALSLQIVPTTHLAPTAE